MKCLAFPNKPCDLLTCNTKKRCLWTEEELKPKETMSNESSNRTAEEAAKLYCDVQIGDKAKLISDRSIDSWDDSYDAFIAGYKESQSTITQLREENERLKASISAGHRLRVADAASAISEANQLRTKIEEQELIIHGIDEGSGEWQSKCRDLERSNEIQSTLIKELVEMLESLHNPKTKKFNPELHNKLEALLSKAKQQIKS